MIHIRIYESDCNAVQFQWILYQFAGMETDGDIKSNGVMIMGIIFNIQKFCTGDGPGIRTTVFLKGCPLDCVWCHNPESKSTLPELSYIVELCVQCGRCAALCPNGCHLFEGNAHLFRCNACVACGNCIAPMCSAMTLIGREVSVNDVIDEVLKDKRFYDHSGGGLTLSGGEPMLQFDFTYALLQAAKQQGLHVCLGTCGFAATSHIRQIASLVDIFLFDYKLTDAELHKQYTGVDNRLILDNLRLLDIIGSKVILCCPIIPGLNDTSTHFQGIVDTANRLKNVVEIQVEPYHSLGEHKAKNVGRDYQMPIVASLEKQTIDRWIATIQSGTTIPVV